MVTEFIQESLNGKVKKIRRVILYAGVLLISLKGIVFATARNYQMLNAFLPFVVTCAGGGLRDSLVDCFDNTTWKEQLRLLYRKNKLNKDSDIRISFAYLFRIKIDGKYLLVPNGRGTGKYQPVGGAYKVDDSEIKYLKEKYHYSEDSKIPVDNHSKNDYRMLIKARDLKLFMKRFDKTVNREMVNNLSREFKEELVATGVIEPEVFKEIQYRYCGRHISDLNESRHFRCYELLLADIVELNPTQEQEEHLRSLLLGHSDKYFFATKEEILHCGIEEGTERLNETISDHTFKILDETEYNLVRVKRDRGEHTVNIR